MAASVYQSYVLIHYQGVHRSEGYLPLEWKCLHHRLWMFVQSL